MSDARGTEDINPRSRGMDALPTRELLELMASEDSHALEAVRKALPEIESAVSHAADAIKGGGRVYYAGAGTSGRLAVLDASEIVPTFGVAHGLFKAFIAGGDGAITVAVEGAEDDDEAGRVAASELSEGDFAMGVSASGGTPYVISFLREAKARGAYCWLMTSNEIEAYTFMDGVITLLTGPELISGSTRLKAGTATKMALNIFSTAVMTRLGHVYDGLMVDVVPSNTKLVKRAIGIIRKVTDVSEEEARSLLNASGMNAKRAIVMKTRSVTRDEAESLLAMKTLREVLEEGP